MEGAVLAREPDCTDVWVENMRRSIPMFRVISNLLTNSVEHLIILQSELGEIKKCVCRSTMWKADQRLFDGSVAQLCSVTFRLQT